MKIKERALSLLLSLVMVLTFMPALAFAEEDPSGDADTLTESQMSDEADPSGAEEEFEEEMQADAETVEPAAEESEAEATEVLEPAPQEEVTAGAANSQESGEYSISLNEKITVTASESKSAVIMFNPASSGAYQINCYSNQSTHVRVSLYESEPIDPEDDSDGWKRIDYTDFDNNEIEGDSYVVDFEYPFLADAGQTYKIVLETSFDESDVEIDVDLKESDMAGVYEGFSYTTFREHDDE